MEQRYYTFKHWICQLTLIIWSSINCQCSPNLCTLKNQIPVIPRHTRLSWIRKRINFSQTSVLYNLMFQLQSIGTRRICRGGGIFLHCSLALAMDTASLLHWILSGHRLDWAFPGVPCPSTFIHVWAMKCGRSIVRSYPVFGTLFISYL